MDWWHVDRAFVTFDRQDSGCLSWGVEHKERRWFVKTAVEPAASAGLARVVDLHRAVTHDVLVAPLHVLERPEGVTLIFPWRRGRVLNRATVDGADRSELAWRGTSAQAQVVARATATSPDDRYQSVGDLVDAWRATSGGGCHP